MNGRIPSRRFRFAVALALACASGAALWAGPAAAQGARDDMRPLLDRIERLERDLRTLNVQIARGGSGGGGTTASGPVDPSNLGRLNDRLNALEDDLRATTGSIEGIGHEVRQMRERLDKLVGDIDYRLSALERGRGMTPGGQASAAPSLPPQGAAPGAAPPAGGSAPGTLGQLSERDLAAAGPAPAAGERAPPSADTQTAAAPLPPGTPKDQYAYAFGLLRQANYEKAEAAFQEFVKQHPKDPLIGNARYWLGETHYVRGDFLRAADVFAENYKQDPKGAKAPDTLLKLGMSLINLDQKKQACLTFDELRKRFPDAPTAIKTSAERERKRAGCG